MDISALVIIGIYLFGMIGIGIYSSRRNRSNQDFYTGSKKLPGWALAISERATTSSSWVMLGATAVVYTKGYSGIWQFFGLYLSLIIYWCWFAKAFKRENDKAPSITLSEFLSKRWGPYSKVIRSVAALIIAVFYIFYAASQFIGMGKTANALFDIKPEVSMLVLAVVVVVYAAFGGLSSIVWTDVIQGIIMCFALIVLPVIALLTAGEAGQSVTQAVTAAGPDYASLFGGMTGGTAILLLFNESSWIWGNFGMPTVTQKIMAIKDEKTIKVGRITGLIWGAVWYLGIFAIGIAGLALYGPNHFDDPETLFPTMVADLLPAGLAVVALCGVVAAIMSTTADQLLAVTGAVSVDFIQDTLHVKVKQERKVLLSSITLIAIGVIALLIGLKSDAMVIGVVSFAWAGMGSSLAPAVLLTMLDKKCSGRGILITLIIGVILVFIWQHIPVVSTLNVKIGPFFVALLTGIICSRILPDKQPVKTEEA